MASESLSQEVRAEIASAFASLVENHSPQLSGHCRRVAHRARKLGKALGPEYSLGETEIAELEIAAYLHDLGLITIPYAVLSKRGANAEVMPDLQQHALSGYAVLSSIQSFERVAVGILHHHEDFNGLGFPSHLWRRAIPLFARIIAVVDTYDRALHVGYSMDPHDKEHAIAAVSERSGKGLDPSIVRVFLGLLELEIAEDERWRYREKQVSPQQLEPGMILARDLRSVGNVVLLRSGTELTRHIIDQILRHDVAGNAVRSVYVERSSLDTQRRPRAHQPEDTLKLSLHEAEKDLAQKRAQVIVLSEAPQMTQRVRAELEPMGMQVRGTTGERETTVSTLADSSGVTIVLDLSIGATRTGEILADLKENAVSPYCVLLADPQTLNDAKKLGSIETVAGVVSEPWPRFALVEAVRKAIDLNHHHRAA